MSRWFTKKPCAHCPFRQDVRPFLHPDRAEELAYLTSNKYAEFHCHKTIDHDDDGEGIVSGSSLVCAGFLSMQVAHGAKCPDGFDPSPLAYEDPSEMADAYAEAWKERTALRGQIGAGS